MNICFIDFETTGIDVFKDNPIEFGAILVNPNGRILKEFHSYISLRNKRAFSANSQKVHGLNELDLLNAPSQKEVLATFFDKMGTEFRFAGWNINFDVSFFRRMCHNYNYMGMYNKINHRHLDVQTMAFMLSEKGLLPQGHKSLNDLVEFFGLQRMVKHSALEDAKITQKIYIQLMSKLD